MKVPQVETAKHQLLALDPRKNFVTSLGEDNICLVTTLVYEAEYERFVEDTQQNIALILNFWRWKRKVQIHFINSDPGSHDALNEDQVIDIVNKFLKPFLLEDESEFIAYIKKITRTDFVVFLTP